MPDDPPVLALSSGHMTAIPDALPPVPDPARDAVTRGARPAGPRPVRLCPFIVGGDGTWRSAHASRAHRCAAVHPATRLAISKQRQLCLVDAHSGCATFLAARALGASPSSESAADDAGLWPDSRPTVVNLEQGRIGLGAIPAAHGRSGGQALLVGLMVLALLVLVIARTTTPSSTAGPNPAAPASAIVAGTASPAVSAGVVDASPSPTTEPSASTSGSPAPSGEASPSPGNSPGPQASPAGSSPAPAASDARTYKVRSGDTLSTIALKFGVTVKAIKLANGITDPRVIRVGRILVIP